MAKSYRIFHRCIKSGNHEIDLLGIRPGKEGLEGWHVEVQVSFRPISYLGRLSPDAQKELGVKSSGSMKKRPADFIKASIEEWVEKKFHSPRKREMRDRCWKNIDWQYKFVHGVVHDQAELTLISQRNIDLVSFNSVLRSLCEHKQGELFGGAGTDIAEIIRYFAKHPEKTE